MESGLRLLYFCCSFTIVSYVILHSILPIVKLEQTGVAVPAPIDAALCTYILYIQQSELLCNTPT